MIRFFDAGVEFAVLRPQCAVRIGFVVIDFRGPLRVDIVEPLQLGHDLFCGFENAFFELAERFHVMGFDPAADIGAGLFLHDGRTEDRGIPVFLFAFHVAPVMDAVNVHRNAVFPVEFLRFPRFFLPVAEDVH